MIDGKAAIAILGPDGPSVAPAIIDAARAVGRQLADAGYALVVFDARGNTIAKKEHPVGLHDKIATELGSQLGDPKPYKSKNGSSVLGW